MVAVPSGGPKAECMSTSPVTVGRRVHAAHPTTHSTRAHRLKPPLGACLTHHTSRLSRSASRAQLWRATLYDTPKSLHLQVVLSSENHRSD